MSRSHLPDTNWYSELLDIHLETPIVSICAGRFLPELYFTYTSTNIRNSLDLFLLGDLCELVYQYIGCAVEQARLHLDYDFYAGYGFAQGPSFTAWTETRVYFPVQYDGSEWIGSVDRQPCCETTHHIGGG